MDHAAVEFAASLTSHIVALKLVLEALQPKTGNGASHHDDEVLECFVTIFIAQQKAPVLLDFVVVYELESNGSLTSQSMRLTPLGNNFSFCHHRF